MVVSTLAWNRKVEKFVILFTEDIINLFCSCITIYSSGDMAMLDLSCSPVVVTPLQITCMKSRYSFSAKLDTRVIFFQSIAPPTKHSRAWFIQYPLERRGIRYSGTTKKRLIYCLLFTDERWYTCWIKRPWWRWIRSFVSGTLMLMYIKMYL